MKLVALWYLVASVSIAKQPESNKTCNLWEVSRRIGFAGS